MALFSKNFDPEEVTPAWIQENMDRLGLERSDLIRDLHIRKEHLSRWMNGVQSPTKGTKVGIGYYFKFIKVMQYLEKQDRFRDFIKSFKEEGL